MATSKNQTVYRITETRYSLFGTDTRVYHYEGTVEELTKIYEYTLLAGSSYEHEKGSKKINRNPNTIKSLITNVRNAMNNSARNGYSGCSITAEVIGKLTEA